MWRKVSFAFAALITAAILGCDAGSNPQSNSGSAVDPPSKALVDVEPRAIGQVWQGTKTQFAATVTGSQDQAVSWKIEEGSVGGTIDSNGLYTAPTLSGRFHVVATAVGSPSAEGRASVDVVPITISISPAEETLRVGGQRKFGGFVLAADQHVTWSLQEGTLGGNITSEGLYTAPDTTGTFHLVATSVFDTNVSKTAPVTIVNVGFMPVGDMTAARSRHTATLLLDGKVLIAGGTTDSTHTAEVYDPASISFAPTSGEMVHLRNGHSATLLQDGRVLISGGGDASGNLFKTAELFNPATQSFNSTGDLNQPRTNATATLLPNGKVLIAGGEDSDGAALATAEIYDPGTGTFRSTGNLQFPRSQHTATLLTTGKVLLVGNSGGTDTAELFDPNTGLFTRTGSLIVARSHQTVTLLPNGKALVLGGTQVVPPIGGGAPPAPVSLESAEVYDPSTGVFQAAGKLLVARDSHSATLLANGTVLVAGGYSRAFDSDAQPSWYTMSVTEIFDPVTSTSTTAASLGTDRAGHIATMLNDGEILVTGGISGLQELCCLPVPYVNKLASAELYR